MEVSVADTVFKAVSPNVKAVDLGDGTYALAVVIVDEAAVPVNTTFRKTLPPTEAVDLGDGTYAISAVFG